MIKLIGIGIMLLGFILLITSIINARRGGSSKAAAELSLILDAGYADTHRQAKGGARLQEDLNIPKDIKIAPKKRTLSKEAQEILDLVEKERAAERGSFETPSGKTPSNPEDSTGIMPKKRQVVSESTDILNKKAKPAEEGTDILDRNKGKKANTQNKDGTDILKRDAKSGGPTKDGTDILVRKPTQEKTDILKRGPATDSGTDILEKRR